MTFSSTNPTSSTPSLLRRVRAGISWLAVAQIGGRAWSLVVTVILARLLTPKDFGLIALTMLSIGVISMFAETGLTSAIIQRSDITEEHLSTAFWLNTGVNCGLVLVGMLLAHPLSLLYHEPRLPLLIRVMMLSLPLNGMGQVSGTLLQKRLAFRPLAIIDIGSALLAGIIGIALALNGAGVWALVVQSLVLPWARSLGRAIVAHWNPLFLFDSARLRDLLGFSLSVWGCAVVNYVLRNVDNALVGGTLGATALGFYSVAYNLVLMPTLIIGGLVAQVMFPALSSLQNDMARLRGAYLRALRMVSLATFPLVVGMGAVAPLFIKAIYGPHWEPVVPLLQIMCIIGVFEAVNIWGVVFFALGRPNILLAWSLLSLVVMTIAFALSVRWGTIGVAWSYVLVSPIVSLGPHLLLNRLMSLPFVQFLKAFGPTLVSALLMGAFLRAASLHWPTLFGRPWLDLIAFSLLGATLYCAALASLGALSGHAKRLIPWLTGETL